MTTAATTWNEATPRRADNVEIAPRLSEDWLSLIIGLFIFVLALAGIANVDLLGWVVTTSVWNDIGKALGTVSKSYASLGGFGALVATYLALLVVLSAAAVALKSELIEVRAGIHGGVLGCLCELGDRQFRELRGCDSGRSAEIRPKLVARTHE